MKTPEPTEANIVPAGPPPGPGESAAPRGPGRYPYATWSPWLAIGGSIAALLLGVLLALPVIWGAGGGEYDSLDWGVKAAVQFCTALGFLAVPLLFARGIPPAGSWSEAVGRLGFHRFRVGNAAKWIGIGMLAYLGFALFYVSVFGEPRQDDIAGELGPAWSQILLIVILAPLAEEVCFRGMLFGGFRTRFNLPVAALGAGLVFGLLHYSTGITAVPQLIVLGAIFAVVYEKTESIWPPVIFHLINNAWVLIALNA